MTIFAANENDFKFNMKITEKNSNEVILNNDGKNLQSKKEMIVEMARINMKESNIFPYNKFEVKIWSDDHIPPHFHIKSDGWNISYVIETGKQLEILEEGEKNLSTNIFLTMLINGLIINVLLFLK